jgi:predicted nucleotidyltransferase
MPLRIALLIGNALLLVFFAYVVIDSSIIHPHKEAILDYVIVYGIFIYLIVNFIYLVRRQRK